MPRNDYNTSSEKTTFFLGAILFAFVFAFGIVYFIFQMDSKSIVKKISKELANIPF
jgi:hypothetical protein